MTPTSKLHPDDVDQVTVQEGDIVPPPDLNKRGKKYLPTVLMLTKNDVSDAGRLEMIDKYLKEKSTKLCKHLNGKDKKCKCLSVLMDNEEGQEAVANEIRFWASLTPFHHKLYLIQKIKNIFFYVAHVGDNLPKDLQVKEHYEMPLQTDNAEFKVNNKEVSEARICDSALITLFCIGRDYWKMLKG